jgi:hypothetical protein
MILDLSDQETDALARLLRRTIDDDRYPLSPRVQVLKAVLDKIRQEPAREPLPPPKVYAPPRATAGRRRRADRRWEMIKRVPCGNAPDRTMLRYLKDF